MTAHLEYRVIWQREGQKEKQRRIYQTLKGAERCAKVQSTAHEEMTWLNEEGWADSRPKPIIFGPIIESRMVDEWVEVEEI